MKGAKKRCRTFGLPVQLAVLLIFVYSSLNGQSSEYDVKAVFIYNFVNFVEWPDRAFSESSNSFIIGVAGTNVFGNTLTDVVKGETYRGRPIEVRIVSDVDQAKGCQILFIEKSCINLIDLISNTSSDPILTISDTDDFMAQGGVIRFFLEQSKVKIEINQHAAHTRNFVDQCKASATSKNIRQVDAQQRKVNSKTAHHADYHNQQPFSACCYIGVIHL